MRRGKSSFPCFQVAVSNEKLAIVEIPYIVIANGSEAI